jgi:hypothetical protein
LLLWDPGAQTILQRFDSPHEEIESECLTVDDRATVNELHTRMKPSGLDTSYYLLPVVDVNDSLSIRPENDELVTRAKAVFH